MFWYTKGVYLEGACIEEGSMKMKVFKQEHNKNMQWFEPTVQSAVLPVVQKELQHSAFPNTEYQHLNIKLGI